MTGLILYDSMSIFRMRLENGERHVCRGIANEAMQPNRIFCWEGKGGNDRRRALYPSYKDRPPAPSNMLRGLSLIRELIGHTPAFQASLPGFEADDIIAALCARFPVARIETLDGDLAALGVPTTRKSKIEPHLVRLFKVFVGDPSDVIRGVKGFGKGAWDNADKRRLQELLDLILNHQAWTDTLAEQAGLSKASINWLRDNEVEVIAMHTIIRPFEMTDEELEQALHPGKDNPIEREKIMREFML